MYPRVSIHIVAYNSMDFLPELLASIFAQTFTDFNVLVVDNASSDGVATYLRDEFPKVALIRNARNVGFSGAHNLAIRYAVDHWGDDDLTDRFVLITNPDVILSPTFLEEIVKTASFDSAQDGPSGPAAIGSYQGKLLRAFKENAQDEVFCETVKSERIDSTGLAQHRNRTVTDRGAGELDKGQYDASTEIFGAAGALAFYRASTLQALRYGDEFLDHDFFLYKEDVDLAWRAKRRGFTSRYVPKAVAYHHRAAYGAERQGWFARIKNRRGKSPMRNWYSTRNHLLLVLKNEGILSGLLALPWIAWFEFRRFVYVLVLETRNVSAYFSALKLSPRILKKRFSRTLKP